MASIDELSFAEQQMPSAILTGINFSILTDTEAVSVLIKVYMLAASCFFLHGF